MGNWAVWIFLRDLHCPGFSPMTVAKLQTSLPTTICHFLVTRIKLMKDRSCTVSLLQDLGLFLRDPFDYFKLVFFFCWSRSFFSRSLEMICHIPLKVFGHRLARIKCIMGRFTFVSPQSCHLVSGFSPILIAVASCERVHHNLVTLQ